MENRMVIQNRRSFLRGAGGALLSLPLLNSVAPAAAAMAKPTQKMAFYYVPIGVVRRGFFPGAEVYDFTV